MKTTITILFLTVISYGLHGQSEQSHHGRFVAGLSGPELLHIGVTYRLAGISLLGINAGIGPSAGTAWTAISFEHRLYFGAASGTHSQKTWFCRQGTTFFPQAKSPQQFTFNLTFGKDLPFKYPYHGATIDAGVFYLPESESSSLILIRSLNLWPALRFELYFG